MRAFPSLAIGIQIGILSSMNGTVFYSATRRIWIARYPAGLHGTPKIIAGYGKTREKAIRNRERALGRAIAGNQYHHGEQAHTTAKYMQLYFDELNAGDDRPNTLARKQDTLERYLAPFMKQDIRKISRDDCIGIIAKARAASKDPHNSKGAQTIWSQMAEFFGWCIECGYLEQSPLRGVAKPKYQSAARRRNEESIEQRIAMGRWLLDFTANHMDEYLVGYGMTLAAALGLRAGEIRGLQWNCITHLNDGEAEKSTILVRQQWDRDVRTGQWQLMPYTKSNARESRRVPIPLAWHANWQNYYDAVMDVIPIMREQPVNGDEKAAFCFPNKDGRPLSKNQQADIWNALKAEYIKTHPTEAAADTMRLHDMRHVVASVLVMNGATLEQVRPILGWSDGRMAEYYTHLSQEYGRKTMNRIPALLNHGDDAQAFGAFMDSPAYDRQAEAAHQAWKAADEDIQRA